MTLKSHLLSAAVVAALTLPISAFAATPARAPAASRALGLIDGHGQAVQRADFDRFLVKDVIVDRDGTEHVRFDRTYRGLPVIGGDVVVHSRNGQFKSASLMLKTSERPGIVPRIKSDEAMVAAGADFHGKIDSVSSQGLVVYAAQHQAGAGVRSAAEGRVGPAGRGGHALLRRRAHRQGARRVEQDPDHGGGRRRPDPVPRRRQHQHQLDHRRLPAGRHHPRRRQHPRRPRQGHRQRLQLGRDHDRRRQQLGQQQPSRSVASRRPPTRTSASPPPGTSTRTSSAATASTTTASASRASST